MLLSGFEAEGSGTARRAAGVVGMLHAVQDGHFGEIERADAVEAGDVDAVLRLVGAALVMGINSAA